LFVVAANTKRVADLEANWQSSAESQRAGFVVNLEEPSLRKALASLSEDKPSLQGASGMGENEWYTPEEHVAIARDALGGFDLDPASSDVAQGII
jgi:hypothetical protein